MQSVRLVVLILRFGDYFGRILRLTCLLGPVELFYLLTSWSYQRELWIFAERPDEARDNAYELFRYIKESHPEISAIYAIRKESRDFTKIADVGDYVEHGSFRHYCLYSKSKVAVSTHIFGASPIGGVAKYLAWISPRRCNVFLQHGIYKDHYSAISKRATGVDFTTCAASAEYEYIRKFGGYASHEVGLVGLARFDRLAKAKADKSKILFMPTFRKELFNLSRLNTRTAAAQFQESSYYKSLQEVLSNSKLKALLEYYDINLSFFLHPSAQPFIDVFHTDSDFIDIASRKSHDLQELISCSALLITDYSSVFFDFAYLSRPVIYYQFDYEQYRESQYREGYFDYMKNGFGPIVRDCSGVVEALEGYLKGGMRPEPHYVERRNGFFLPYDGGNCRRIMAAILSHPKVVGH